MSNDELSIKTVLAYYRDEAQPALAAAVVADERFPVEVLNELRNSYTHLAEAQLMVWIFDRFWGGS